MKTNLFLRIACTILSVMLLFVSNAQVLVNATLGKTFSLSAASGIITPSQYSANAAYSNVDNYTGSGYANGGVANVAGTRTTVMVGDDLNFITVGLSAPYSIATFYWSVANFNAAAASARPTVRFYLADGAGGKPGTYVTGFLFNPININASSGGFFSFSPPGGILITSSNIWACLYWDNGGASTATNAQLANFGQLMFDPSVTGTSADQMFITTSAGTFAANNPAGTIFSSPFGAAPKANFGWEFVSSTPLPVVIDYFRGTKNSAGHNLTWKVNCINTGGATITLERSNDNQTFSSIYSEKVTVQRCQQPFSFIDRTPLSGTNYYRLKMVDAEGKLSYSMISAIMNRTTGFELVGISPNPAQTVAVLNTTSAQADKLQVNVYNISGQKVMATTENIIAGSNQIELNVASLATGIYKVTVTGSAGEVKTISLFKK
ncbi:hypothetical protein BH09BAC2_BH09BAC2_13430 [soil metagenome]